MVVYIHHDILSKASECKTCSVTGKNLEPVIPQSKWSSSPNCIEPNDEIKTYNVGLIITEKESNNNS